MYLKTIKHNLEKNLVIYYLLLSGLLLRLIFASFPGFHVDTDTFFAWSVRAYELGLAKFYSPDTWTNYTPGMIYLLYFFGFLKSILAISGEWFYFVLKLPSIFADLLLSFLIYRELIKNRTQKIALYGLLFTLFNPVLIFNASIWGAFDGFMTLFLFLTIKYLAEKKLILSSIYFGISLLVKPQAIAIAPVLGLFVLQNFSIKTILKLSVPALLTVIILSIPFFPSDPLLGFFKLFIQMAQDYKGNSLFAYNLWGVFGFWIEDSTALGFFSYRVWGLLLMSIFWIYVYTLFFKKKFNPFVLATLAFLAFFFLPTRVHERYLFSAIPFLTLIAFQLRSKMLVILTILLSIFHVINLYYVYVYYNEFYLKLPKTLYLSGFYESLESGGKLLSFISTLIFALIVVVIIKTNLRKHDH